MNINGEPTRNDKTLNGETSLGDSTADDLIISGDLTVGGTSSFDGQLDMNNAKIVNLGTPTNSADATTKAYVDSVIPDVTGFLKTDGSNSMSASLDAGTNKVINVVDPAAAQDAATKNYVDTTVPSISGLLKIDGSNAMTASLDAGSNKIKNVTSGTSSSDAVNLSQLTSVISSVNTNTANIATNATNIATNTSNIATNTNNISTNTSNITANTTDIAGCLKLDGTNAMTGDLDAGTNKIINVVDPTSNQDAATKKYVDDNAGSSPWSIAAANIYRVGGKVGIGSTGALGNTPTSLLDIQGNATSITVPDKIRISDDMTNIGATYGFNAYANGGIFSWNKNEENFDGFDSHYTFRQSNTPNSDTLPTAFTQLKMGQKIRSNAYPLASRQSAVWELNISNERGSFAGFQNESSILCLLNDGGSVVINSGSSHQNRNFRLFVYGSGAATGGFSTYSDDRIKYNEQNITGALDAMKSPLQLMMLIVLLI